MKRKYIKKSCILIIVLALSISGCGYGKGQAERKEIGIENSTTDKEKSEEEIIKVKLPQKFINLSGKGAAGVVEDTKIVGKEHYIDVYENEDGTVTVEITKEQQQDYWLPSREDVWKGVEEQLKEYDENYRLEHNDSYTQVDAYYNQELPWDKAGVFMIYAEVLCASYQLFSGVDSDSWRVEINIYNSDTGKLVKSGSSDADMTYDDSDWEASK